MTLPSGFWLLDCCIKAVPHSLQNLAFSRLSDPQRRQRTPTSSRASWIFRQIFYKGIYRLHSVIEDFIRRPEITAPQVRKCCVGGVIDFPLTTLTSDLPCPLTYPWVGDDDNRCSVEQRKGAVRHRRSRASLKESSLYNTICLRLSIRS